jgi:outer membrane protein assembly factor BamE (lipoprotein component of BamABCDE complex)
MRTRTLLLIAGAALLCGCNTPESRIKKNPDLFNSYTPDVQENIKQGKVALGFTQDMVTMALGRADRVYTRKTAASSSEVWAYTTYYTTLERQRVRADVRVRDIEGGYRTVVDDVWVDVEQRHEYDKLRVEFDGNGLVAAIETNER